MDALITVTGKQRNLGDDDEDVLEITSRGKFYENKGIYYIFYDEQTELASELVHWRVKIDKQNNIVEISKKDPLQNQLLFELGKKTNSLYHTEFGLMEMGMDTDRLQMILQENGLYLELHYMMEINCQLVGENTITLSVVGKRS